MLIGVMSDSHDHQEKLKKAVESFNARGVGIVIHAGDFVAPFSLKCLESLSCPWIGVFGNCDGERKGLTLKSEGRIQEPPYELNLGGKSIYVTHNLEDVPDGKVPGRDIVIYGHTHEPAVSLKEKQLYINPGELCGVLTGKSTVAVVDTEAMTAEVVEVQ